MRYKILCKIHILIQHFSRKEISAIQLSRPTGRTQAVIACAPSIVLII